MERWSCLPGGTGHCKALSVRPWHWLHLFRVGVEASLGRQEVPTGQRVILWRSSTTDLRAAPLSTSGDGDPGPTHSALWAPVHCCRARSPVPCLLPAYLSSHCRIQSIVSQMTSTQSLPFIPVVAVKYFMLVKWL